MTSHKPLLTPDEALGVVRACAARRSAEPPIIAYEWRLVVEKNAMSALIDKMGEACASRGVADASTAQTDPGYAAKSQEALDEVLAPYGKIIGHDWIGRVLGFVDATDDEALEGLFHNAAGRIAEAAWEKGVKDKGSEAKFLASEGIVSKQIEDAMEKQNNAPVYSEQDKPFIEFKDAVEKAACEMMGAEWWASAVSGGATEGLRTALQCGGYEGSDTEVESLRHALSIQPVQTTPEGIVETPAPAAASVVTTTLTQPASDGAMTVAQAVGFARTVMKDPDIAELLGVSRGTVANIEKGTAKTPVTAEGATNLLAKLNEIGNAANMAADVLHAHATA